MNNESCDDGNIVAGTDSESSEGGAGLTTPFFGIVAGMDPENNEGRASVSMHEPYIFSFN